MARILFDEISLKARVWRVFTLWSLMQALLTVPLVLSLMFKPPPQMPCLGLVVFCAVQLLVCAAVEATLFFYLRIAVTDGALLIHECRGTSFKGFAVLVASGLMCMVAGLVLVQLQSAMLAAIFEVVAISLAFSVVIAALRGMIRTRIALDSAALSFTNARNGRRIVRVTENGLQFTIRNVAFLPEVIRARLPAG